MSTDGSPTYERFLLNGAAPFGSALPHIFSGYLASFRDYLGEFPASDASVLSEGFSRGVNTHFFRYVSELSNHYDPHLSQGPGRNSLRVQDPNAGAPARPSRYSLLFGQCLIRSAALTRQLRAARERLPSRRSYDNPGDQPALIMSPLYFCRQILTSPEYTASQAFAHATIRAYLFEETLKFEEYWPPRVRPESVTQLQRNLYLRIRDIIQFDRVEASLRKLESFARNRDNLPLKDSTDFLVSHLLASRGILSMRFEGPDGATDGSSDDRRPTISLGTFLSEGALVSRTGLYQFDMRAEVRKLPSAAELINELDGLPIALPGVDKIFDGGLRFTTESGVLARISGPAGIGKTSLALALATALSPLGTQTIYMSCEERAPDLLHRIRTLVPTFIQRSQSYRDPKNWFSASYVTGAHKQKREAVFAFLNETLTRFAEELPRRENTPPGLMPLLIVLDGVHEMFPAGADPAEQSGEALRELVTKCQATGALVVAMSSEQVRGDLAEFDYLVDVVASLEYSSSMTEMEPSTRIFRLKKTRRQQSRTGAHRLELSANDGGLSIVPHIQAYLSEARGRFWIEPSDRLIVDFLIHRDGFIPSPTSVDGLDEPLAQIRDRSQVLVMGKGSSGKSLFGLRVLASPFINDARLQRLTVARKARSASRRTAMLEFPPQIPARPSDEEDAWGEALDPSKRRILILSFLYQQPYYERLRRTQRNWTRDSLTRVGRIEIDFDVEHFEPGYVTAEEMIERVVERLDSAELSGDPVQGVLVDGIHNVFLQYPSLEASEIVWPALYELLRVRGLLVVTTHTYFDVSDYGAMMQDLEASRRRVAPLLHALVQSSDYVFKIHPVGSLRFDEGSFAQAARDFYGLESGQRTMPVDLTYRPAEPARYLIEVPGALSQTFVEPPVDWGWDRNRGTAFQARKRGDVEISRRTTPPKRD